jgi:peptidoglycan/xylan/chitin deacetylase (PgdA/CDA1 family)
VSEFRVALTFDAEHPSRRQCPPGNVDRILATLAEEKVRASFFLQGRWVTAYPGAAAAIAANGHLVGNHSHWHAPMSLLSDDGIAIDVKEAQDRIATIAGLDPRPWFRCPFGKGADDRRVLDKLASCGYRNVHWTVAGDDWLDDRSPDDLQRDLLAKTLQHGDGAVVLLHTWPAAAAAALPGLIQQLAGDGARFVAIDELADG